MDQTMEQYNLTGLASCKIQVDVLTLSILSRQALLQFLNPLMGFLLAPLLDFYTTFGRGNQCHLGPL